MMYRVETRTGPRTISIELPDEPFGVLISGGFDSTLLLYLVASQAGERPFFTCNVQRGTGTEKAAVRVVKAAIYRFGCKITHRQLCTVGAHNVQVLNAAESYLKTGEVKKLLVADTTNPPDLEEGPWRQPVENQFAFPKWSFPFLHCDKSHMVALAEQLGFDDVFDLTHTCTDYADLECGQCWQCRERAWGIAQNDLQSHRR